MPESNTKFSPGDLVRVIRQPENQHVRLLGEVGFIDELLEVGSCGTYAQIQTLCLDSFLGGYGGVPVSCLEHEHEQCWVEAKRKYDEHLAEIHAVGTAFSNHVRNGLAEIAKKHGISVEEVEEISSEVNKLYH